MAQQEVPKLRPDPPVDPLLMIPGPSDVAWDVLAEMSRQVVAHYGASWAEFYNGVVAMGKQVLQTKADLFIYAGSGHLGLDAVIGSLFEPGDQVVVACNGYFGERLAELAVSQELQVIRCDAPWGKPVCGTDVAACLDAHPKAKGVLIVHGETSTGLLNPVEEIAREAKARGRLVIVDAVSTAGVAPLEVDAWGIDACVTASQKGLGAPPGVVLVTVSAEGWEAVEGRKTPIRGWSTNLAKWREFLRFRDYQPYFITMPVNVVRALAKSLESVMEEGLETRFARHREVSRLLRESLAKMGLKPVVTQDGFALPSVTAFRCPTDWTAPEIRDALRAQAGIQVSPGLGPWTEQVVRVGHMGINATAERVFRVLGSLGEVLGRKPV